MYLCVRSTRVEKSSCPATFQNVDGHTCSTIEFSVFKYFQVLHVLTVLLLAQYHQLYTKCSSIVLVLVPVHFPATGSDRATVER